MPPVLALDISALALTVMGSIALILMAVGGNRSRLSLSFAVYAVMATAYSTCSLLLRVSLWFSYGSPDLLLQLSAASLCLSGPALLLFASRYLCFGVRWATALSAALMVLTAAAVPLVIRGGFIWNPMLTPAGVTIFHASPLGIAAAAVTGGVPMAITLALFWARRALVREPFIALAAAVALAGFVVGGLTMLPVPVFPYTSLVSVGALGYAVVRLQIFNPFRALSHALEGKVTEGRRAEESLRERARRLELISSIGQKTTALIGLDELFSQAVTLIRDAFSYFSVGILLVEGEYLVTRASSLPALKRLIGQYRLKVGVEGLSGRVAATGEPLLVNDVRADSRYVHLDAEADTRSELDVPIRAGGRVIGVLDAQSVQPDGFTELDLFTMQTIADQLAVAIQNSRLYEQAMRRAGRIALVGRISAAVSAVLNLRDLMETVYREVTPFFSADAFFIALYDEATDELDFRIQVDEGVREPSARQQVGSGLTSRVIRERRALLVADMRGELDALPTPELWGTGKLPTSWLGVPMLLGEKLIGVICVQTYGEHAYDDEDRGLLGTIADQVAVAVENARLYDALRLELLERQRTETGLRESEEQFRNLAEQSPNMIFINEGGRVVYANRQCEVVTGYTREQFYSPAFRFTDMAAPEHRELLAASFRKHFQGRELSPYEYSLLTRDGRRVDAIITTKLISYAGKPAILGIITDISTRKRTERLLRALNTAALAMEQAYTPRETFQGAVRELARLGLSCTIFLANDARTHMAPRYVRGPDDEALDLSEEERLQAWHAVEKVPELAMVVRERRTILSRLDPATLVKVHEGSAGEALMAIRPGEPLGTILAPLAVAEDVFGMLAVHGEAFGDEDLQAVSAFAHQTAAAWRKTTLMRDLEGSLEELKAAQEQLLHAQKMQAIGRLAGGIAHDFNNVLTVISGYVALLGEGLASNDAAQTDIGEIKNAIKRAAALTSRLLAFSRKQILQPQVLDLNSVVTGCAKLLGPLIGEDIELDVLLGGEPGQVLADPYQLEQVVINLAVNARDAMPEGGRLVLQTSARTLTAEEAAPLDLEPGPHVCLVVSDTGVGMSAEVMSHLFEPFFTTKEDGKGTGLGLSTVYGIVRQSGGAVSVESEPGRGSRFIILIPASDREKTAPPPERAPARVPGGSGTILLAEDDELVRELAERILGGGGYTVLAASSGEEALRFASAMEGIRLVVTDVVMPGGMSGVELADGIREIRPGTPVLFISGYTEERAIHLQVPQGLPFLAKPFQPDELLAKVAELLRASAGADAGGSST
jgi:PAS domain S-box-containing protein